MPSSQKPPKAGIIILIIQVGKLRHQEFEQLAQGYIANRKQLGFEPGCLALESLLSLIVLYCLLKDDLRLGTVAHAFNCSTFGG